MLRATSSADRVVLDGPLTAKQLDRHLPRTALDRLVITDNPALSDLSLLRGRPRIRHLHVESTVRIRDISDVAGSRLATLALDAALLLPEDLEAIPAVDSLRELHLHRLPIGPYAWLPPPHPSVARLSVSSQDLQVDSLHRRVGLRALAVRQPTKQGPPPGRPCRRSHSSTGSPQAAGVTARPLRTARIPAASQPSASFTAAAAISSSVARTESWAGRSRASTAICSACSRHSTVTAASVTGSTAPAARRGVSATDGR
ncbi:hypothetical protein [Streptomyces sp. NPDC088766]|uniref:hypothetical protein n=1 Tax=Streptomyces sp. NPDC088766 TaxID=3365893 RepID=UPI0038201A05